MLILPYNGQQQQRFLGIPDILKFQNKNCFFTLCHIPTKMAERAVLYAGLSLPQLSQHSVFFSVFYSFSKISMYSTHGHNLYKHWLQNSSDWNVPCLLIIFFINSCTCEKYNELCNIQLVHGFFSFLFGCSKKHSFHFLCLNLSRNA